MALETSPIKPADGPHADGPWERLGKMIRGEKIRLVRGEETLWTGRVEALKRFKDDVKEVEKGFECGITLDGYSDLKEGDRLESFKIEELARTL